MLSILATALTAENLLHNGQFDSWEEGKPDSWTMRMKQPYTLYTDHSQNPAVTALKDAYSSSWTIRDGRSALVFITRGMDEGDAINMKTFYF